MNLTKLFCAVLLVLSFSGCHGITPPKDPTKDTPPIVTITVNNLRTHYAASYTTNQTLGISAGTQLAYLITGFNSVGGVKQLSFSMPDIPPALSASGSLDASGGNAPEQLQLIGADTYPTQGGTYTVTASSVNFNSEPTTVVLTINVDFNPPTFNYLKWDVDPRNGDTDGYINLGESIHLNWSINDCNGCKVSVLGQEGNYDDTWILRSINATNLPAIGAILVHPSLHYCAYTVTAAGPHGTVSQTIKQSVYWPSPTPPTGTATRYFKVVSSSNCWTQAVVCQSDAQGEAFIQQGNGSGLSITPISQAEFGVPATCGN